MWPFKTESQKFTELKTKYDEMNKDYRELKRDYVYLLGSNSDLRKQYSYRTPRNCECKCCER